MEYLEENKENQPVYAPDKLYQMKDTVREMIIDAKSPEYTQRNPPSSLKALVNAMSRTENQEKRRNANSTREDALEYASQTMSELEEFGRFIDRLSFCTKESRPSMDRASLSSEVLNYALNEINVSHTLALEQETSLTQTDSELALLSESHSIEQSNTSFDHRPNCMEVCQLSKFGRDTVTKSKCGSRNREKVFGSIIATAVAFTLIVCVIILAFLGWPSTHGQFLDTPI
mmetsp:Transcript_10822/g.19576  ORF Transcript_10822/g.19576 Transcript_10822/m.19576 type:complete len:230 (-) Transcript_10822:142-831(-)